MDPFRVRIEFLELLRRLSADQQSIQVVVGFAIKYFSTCGEDLWDCILEECRKGSLNMRINILYCLHSLCEASIQYQSRLDAVDPQRPASYIKYVQQDLDRIVQLVVPDSRDGLVNLASARQILESWKANRLLDASVLDEVIQMLDARKESLHSMAPADARLATTAARSEFSHQEIIRRFDQDRERHKLLRQKRWVLPIPSIDPRQPQTYSKLASTIASSAGTSQSHPAVSELALDIEFEHAWETTSDWNDDDDETVRDENVLCFPGDVVNDRMEVG